MGIWASFKYGNGDPHNGAMSEWMNSMGSVLVVKAPDGSRNIVRSALPSDHATPGVQRVHESMHDFVEACIGGDQARVKKLVDEEPWLWKVKVRRTTSAMANAVTPKRVCYTHEWDILSEVISAVHPNDTETAPMQVLSVLVQRFRQCGFRLDDLPVKSDSGASPLHQAANRSCWRAMEILLDAGADPFAQTRSGWLPLHTLCRPLGRSEDLFALMDTGRRLTVRMNALALPAPWANARPIPRGYERYGLPEILAQLFPSPQQVIQAQEIAMPIMPPGPLPGPMVLAITAPPLQHPAPLAPAEHSDEHAIANELLVDVLGEWLTEGEGGEGGGFW